MDTNHAKEPAAMNLLKVSQIAVELQVTGACVYAWIKQGKIPSVRIGKLVRVDREELNRFLARRTQSGSRSQGETR